jgi:hypothetical protein
MPAGQPVTDSLKISRVGVDTAVFTTGGAKYRAVESAQEPASLLQVALGFKACALQRASRLTLNSPHLSSVFFQGSSKASK